MNVLLPEEKGIRIHINGELYVTLMATPHSLRHLVIGYLFNSGLIHSIREIKSVYACDEETDVFVVLNHDIEETAKNLLITAACGSVPVLPTDTLSAVRLATLFSKQEIKQGFVRLFRENVLYQKHGAMHSAGLIGNGIFAFAEDIGRHNAHDKVIGIALDKEFPVSDCALICTGRISSEMVSKAVISGLPLIASLSLPTTLAFRLALDFGITLVGRALKEKPLLLTHPNRIRDE